MKINWFSPLQPASTDIAHYTARVLPALIKRAEVTLWTDQSRWDQRLEKIAARVRRYDPSANAINWEELNRADISIYHIGNNPLFHGAIWQMSRQHAGIVVLHDFRLHHFFDGLYRAQWRDRDEYLRVMEFYYGEQGRHDAIECFDTNARNIDHMAESYPLTEHALENALGVITHTKDAFEELKRDESRPVAYLPLPFDAAPREQSEESRKGQREGDHIRVAVFGYIHRNRRLEAIFKALAELPERDQFRLDVYGELLEGERPMRALLNSYRLGRNVKLHGHVKEEVLDEALAQTDLALNLRYPTMGEASGSQLRIWSHALPSLVTQVGWYASLDPHAVSFVRPDEEYEVEDIKAHLRDFLNDREKFVRMGERGRRILDEEHGSELYASALVDFAAQAQSFRAVAASYKLAERAGAVMCDWINPERAHTRLLQNVAREIRALSDAYRV